MPPCRDNDRKTIPRLTRRLSQYDPSVFSPPCYQREAASFLFSWPRRNQLNKAPPARSDLPKAQALPPRSASKVAKSTLRVRFGSTRDDMRTQTQDQAIADSSSGSEEEDELASDDSWGPELRGRLDEASDYEVRNSLPPIAESSRQAGVRKRSAEPASTDPLPSPQPAIEFQSLGFTEHVQTFKMTDAQLNTEVHVPFTCTRSQSSLAITSPPTPASSKQP
ncbi:hypothetical protein FRB90_005189, partial [Tulasnella sp. 427]